MRHDNIGMFWEDLPQERGRSNIVRVQPPIPETGWEIPTSFPRLGDAHTLAVDVETYDPELAKSGDMPAKGPGWARGKGHVVGIAVGAPGGHNWYFPMRHEVEPENNMNPDHVLAWAKDALSKPRQAKVGANLLYDVGWLGEEGVNVKGKLIDVQYAEALLSESDKINLDAMSEKYLGEGKVSNLLYQWCSEFYGGSTKDQRANIYRSPARLVGPYAESDVDLPFKLAPILYEKLKEQNLLKIFDMECKLIPLMIAMRRAGVKINLEKAGEIRAEIIQKVEEKKVQLYDKFGMEVNINAAQSLKKGFDKLGLGYGMTKPSKSFPNGQPSFKKSYLKAMDNQIGRDIIELRELNKIVGTFIDSYLLNSHVDGMLYGQFHTLRGEENGTRSGRLSSSTPNLQNIPVRTEIGALIRTLFTIDDGHKQWRSYDYSQIEYRFLAHFALGPGSEELRQTYIDDPKVNYHTHVHQLIIDRAAMDIGYKSSKNINFGLIYGMGIKTMAINLGVSVAKAREILEAYHNGAPFARATMEHYVEQAKEIGYVETILGRRSRFDKWEPVDIDWSDRKPALDFERAVRFYGDVQRAMTHKSLNRVLQGSAAEMLKMAMLKCWEDGVFDETGVPRSTVHDELNFSDPGGKDEAFNEVKRILESVIKLKVPVIATEERGPNWGQLQIAA